MGFFKKYLTNQYAAPRHVRSLPQFGVCAMAGKYWEDGGHWKQGTTSLAPQNARPRSRVVGPLNRPTLPDAYPQSRRFLAIDLWDSCFVDAGGVCAFGEWVL